MKKVPYHINNEDITFIANIFFANHQFLGSISLTHFRQSTISLPPEKIIKSDVF